MRVVPLCTSKSVRHDYYITGEVINHISSEGFKELGCSEWIITNLFQNEMDRGKGS